MTKQQYEFPQVARLLGIMDKLRDPDEGCPGAKKQNFQTIVPYTIEEVYEVADAIEQGDFNEVKQELGDLLFQIVFYAQLGKEQKLFDFEAIAKTISDKLERRHPHVFAGHVFASEQEQASHWQHIKNQERLSAGKSADTSILASVPSAMTPLIRAQKLQKACASVGFDWTSLPPVVEKIEEEIQEVLEEAEKSPRDQQATEEEVGDLLFAVINLSRHLNVDAETALRKANRKFEKRFRKVENKLSEQGIEVNEASLDKMEQIWQQIKHQH
jgi:ATP diphosphatase